MKNDPKDLVHLVDDLRSPEGRIKLIELIQTRFVEQTVEVQIKNKKKTEYAGVSQGKSRRIWQEHHNNQQVSCISITDFSAAYVDVLYDLNVKGREGLQVLQRVPIHRPGDRGHVTGTTMSQDISFSCYQKLFGCFCSRN